MTGILRVGDRLTITGTALGTVEGEVVEVVAKWNGYKVRWQIDGQVDFIHQSDVDADLRAGRLSVVRP